VRWGAIDRTRDMLRDLQPEAEGVQSKGCDEHFQVGQLAFRDPNFGMMLLRNVEQQSWVP